MNALAKAPAAFRRLPFGARATVWLLGAIVFAIVGLSLEQDPVKRSEAQLQAYERSHKIESAQQGGRAAGGKGAPEEAGAAPVRVPGTEGKDVQLKAGATPSEIADAKIPKGIRADDAGVRRLFAATLGRKGRAGQTENRLVGASCGSGRCRIVYVPDGPGVGRVIETQGPLWAGLASDPAWRSATITALPVTRGKGNKTVGHRTSITCTTAGLARVGKWGVESTPKIRRFCRVAA